MGRKILTSAGVVRKRPGSAGIARIHKIDEHYKNQIDQIEVDEKDLKEKIIKFRQDELDHKDIAYEKGATKKGLYSIMDKVIKTGSKVAIKISEKI